MSESESQRVSEDDSSYKISEDESSWQVSEDEFSAGEPAEPGPIPREEILEICSAEQDPETIGFQFQRTMFRIKDPKRSIKFYSCLGMTLLSMADAPEYKVTLYTMGYVNPGSDEKIPPMANTHERNYWGFTRPSTIGLVYSWGTDNNHSFNYNLGNGFSNISFMVPDVNKATERLQNLGVIFSETPNEGKIGVGLFIDPDGYVIEIYDGKSMHKDIDKHIAK
jgi:lactoylglutathione lyase